MHVTSAAPQPASAVENQLRGQARPRLGFAGAGWIGLHRMRAIGESGYARIAAVSDPSPEALEAAAAVVPEATHAGSFEDLLAMDLDGIVIATPNALHAQQAIAALEHGYAVFCQKPLGRTAAEVRAVLTAARTADLLLGVDMSYRHTRAMSAVRDRVLRGELGSVFAGDMIFHNGYGPDKPWFHDSLLSGGGCMMDLGVHLVDLALWTLGFPEVARVHGSLLKKGEPLVPGGTEVEDFATAEISLRSGCLLRISCSWDLPVGCDALISATFYGSTAGASFRNVNGSFYDFEAVRLDGTASTLLVGPPDDWGGRAAAAWAARLAVDSRYDPAVEQLGATAEILDAVYGR